MDEYKYLGQRIDPFRELGDKDTREQWLQGIATWLGKDWLNEPGYHPIRDLWKRKDWIASSELLSLGEALEKIKSIASTRWVREAATRARSDDRGEIAGPIFEVIAARMLDHENHKVTLPKPSEPGFDLWLTFPNSSKLRVSCRALLPSDADLGFQKSMGLLQPLFPLMVPSKLPTATFLYWSGSKVPKGETLISALPQLAKTYRSWQELQKGYGYAIGDWYFGYTALAGLTKHPFWDKKSSYTFIAVSNRLTYEQIRFESAVRQKIGNLAKHCFDVNDKVSNIIFMKVPQYISIALAKEYLDKIWDSSTQHITGILLYRSSITMEEDLSESRISHEMTFVENPGASISFKTLTGSPPALSINVLIGTSQQEGPQNLLKIGNQSLPMNNSYLFIKGEHFYAPEVDNPSSTTFEMPHFPYIEMKFALGKLGLRDANGSELILTANHPPHEDLTLI